MATNELTQIGTLIMQQAGVAGAQSKTVSTVGAAVVHLEHRLVAIEVLIKALCKDAEIEAEDAEIPRSANPGPAQRERYAAILDNVQRILGAA